MNITLLADSYKYSHGGAKGQYPSNMVSQYEYLSSRGGKHPATIVTGTSYYLQKYLSKRVKLKHVRKAARMARQHGVPFDLDGWVYIATELKGKLPIDIRAAAEGTLIPTGLPLLTVESTDPKVPWIASFVETILMKLWFPITVATESYYAKQLLLKYGSLKWADFALHNLSDRGNSSIESAAIAGFAHLTQFKGTDNFNSIDFCSKYYHSDMAGYSVWASEHSSTTANMTETTREQRLIDEEQWVYEQLVANPDRNIISFVADSNDVYAFTDFCTEPGSRIRELIESRSHQKLVLRPDSGDPIKVISGMLNIMSNNIIYGEPVGDLGSDDFGILWGDGIDIDGIERILSTFCVNRTGTWYDAENFVFGMGGGLVNHTRDTQQFAMKCSSIDVLVEGNPMTLSLDYTEQRDVYKDPITDPGKTSLRGKVTTWFDTDTKEYSLGTVNQQPSPNHICALRRVFLNGEILPDGAPTMEGIRQRSNNVKP